MLMEKLRIALYFLRRRFGSVGIETRLLAGRYGVRVPTRAKKSVQNVRTGCGTNPIRWGPGLFPEGKAAGA
jgi:hypothetical protein